MLMNVNDFLRNPKKEINAGGKIFSLKKAATDPSIKIGHEDVKILNFGSQQYPESSLYIYWAYGMIAPQSGTIQTPVEVLYFGIKQNQVMSPASLRPQDLDVCNIYMCDMSNFINAAVKDAISVSPVGAATEQEAEEDDYSLDDILEIAESESK